MDIYFKINELFENNTNTNEYFYSKIGMTRIGFANMIKNRSLKVDTLEKIAAYFNKPIVYFFTNSENIVSENETKYGSENYKEKYFELLERYNYFLEKYIKNATFAQK